MAIIQMELARHSAFDGYVLDTPELRDIFRSYDLVIYANSYTNISTIYFTTECDFDSQGQVNCLICNPAHLERLLEIQNKLAVIQFEMETIEIGICI